MMGFWAVIEQQCAELREAKTADDVMRILSLDRNPLGPDTAAGLAFFAGGGGDDSVESCLSAAGWHHVWREAEYYWVMEAPNGDKITYIEGDVYRGQQADPPQD